MPRIGKKPPMISLYKMFIDAYFKAHRNDERSATYQAAQVEFNDIKWNSEFVREKIEEYLEIYNASGGIAGANENVSPSSTTLRRRIQTASIDSKSLDEEDLEKKNKSHRRRSSKLSKAEREDETAIQELKRLGVNMDDDTDEEDDDIDDGEMKSSDLDDEDEEDAIKKKKCKKIFYGKKRQYVEPEVIPDPRDLPSIIQGKLLEPLTKRKRQPAQEKVFNELSEINERIASLIQIRQMGLSTPENRKQLKQLMKDRKVKAFALRRLQCRVRASNRYRVKRQQIVDQLYETKPELHPQLKKLYRPGGGRPRIEESCPDLLKIIEEIAKVGAATDDRRRSEILRPCLTLDDLREKIRQRGYDIKRTTLYYRLLPHRAKSIDGRRHVHTAPVRLRRAQNDEHGKHEDGHFASATVRYMRDLASVFGNDCVFYLSQDDKCKVPLGLPAARVQAPMLMHLNYQIHLPDHDWIVAPKHQLTPSVYAGCLLSQDGDLSYAGPTYVAIRSSKHDFSCAETHAQDFDRLVNLKEFENVARDDTGQVKPIVIITVDGGPDENPRFPKTLVASIRKFQKYNMDALFVLCHAPGQSAYNIVERRMAPLSHDMAGLILPHDFYGSHLNDSSVTINVDLEKMNFRKAGQILAERWNKTKIDGFPCYAEYINPPATTENERCLLDTKVVIDSILKQICQEEEDEEGYEHRIRASEQYYEENARARRERTGGDQVKYDIDEYWCAMHVLQTQYTLQIIRCNSIECCGPWRSNYIKVFPHRFLPAPVPFERTPFGVRMADRDCQRGQYYGSLFQRIQFHGVVIQHTQNELLPFDYCCSSVKKELRKRTCRVCHQYIPSAYRMKNHYKIHAQHFDEFDQEKEEDSTIPSGKDAKRKVKDSLLNRTQTSTTNGACKTEMLDWLRGDFDRVEVGSSSTTNKNTSSVSQDDDWVHLD